MPSEWFRIAVEAYLLADRNVYHGTAQGTVLDSTISILYFKGLVIKYGERGLQNGKNAGPKRFAPRPRERVKLLKSGNFLRPLHQYGQNFKLPG